MTTHVDDSICTEINKVSDKWEEDYKTGLCLFNKSSSVDDGLTCSSDFRVLGCNETYNILKEVKKNYHIILNIMISLKHF